MNKHSKVTFGASVIVAILDAAGDDEYLTMEQVRDIGFKHGYLVSELRELIAALSIRIWSK